MNGLVVVRLDSEAVAMNPEAAVAFAGGVFTAALKTAETPIEELRLIVAMLRALERSLAQPASVTFTLQ